MSGIICKNPIGNIGGLSDIMGKEIDQDDIPANSQVLTYNSTSDKWEAQTPPGAGGGEANTVSNVGTDGVGIFARKSGIDLELKKINAGSSKVTVTDDTGDDEVDIDVDESNIKLDDLGTPDDNTDLDATASLHGLMPKADKSKLDGVESGATADQSDSEIETAYNNQVAIVTQAEAEAGTLTTVKRWTPERVKQAIDALGGGGGGSGTAPEIAQKSTDQTVNNSTTLVNDNDLLFALSANRRYYFKLRVLFESGSTPDLDMTFTVPSGATGSWRRDNDTNTVQAFAARGSVAGSNGVTRQAFCEGFVETAGTAGNLQFQWAQDVADATDTDVKDGSVLLVYDLGAA